MIVTMEEAKNLWCPDGFRYAHKSNINRDRDGEGACMCLADKCMAWRWWDMSNKKRGYCGKW